MTRRGQRHIVVGDVHGCLDELLRLLDVLAFDAAADNLVFVGDLVAKGPDSQGVVALARALGALAVCGNHEDWLLRWQRAIVAGTPPPVLGPDHRAVADSLQAHDWAWLSALPLSLALEPELVVVHGGLRPGVAIAAQRPVDLLRGRSLTAAGEVSPNLHAGSPWAAHWMGPEFVFFGHDARRGLQQHPFAWGLDTGCVYGGQLSAAVWPERRLFAVPARRTYVQPK
ncbi:MAG: metallophosphoesterase family protein [Polyangiales bacterium]